MTKPAKKSRRIKADDTLMEMKPRPTLKPIEPMTDTQRRYMSLIKAEILTFGIGPAGTGKTWIAAALAAEAFNARETERVIVTRPAIEAGEGLGFLPGELDEKFDPYFRPVRDVFEERLGQSMVEYMVRRKQLEALPLEYMRGHTFKDCWVILDEAQNTTPAQMKLFLTRVGENCRIIVNGDLTQRDIEGPSGLADALRRTHGMNRVGVAEFEDEDIVRSGFLKELAHRYRDYNSESDDSGRLPAFITGGRIDHRKDTRREPALA